jgi:hypothetical protein
MASISSAGIEARIDVCWVLVRAPLEKFETQALLPVCPTDIVEWFVLRWGLEVTF